MCVLSSEKSTTRTGYKVLALKEGKFYSTFTGQEIKVGKVPFPPQEAMRLCRKWNTNLDRENMQKLPFYRKEFAGKTGIFLKKVDCKELYADMKYRGSTTEEKLRLVIVKVTFANDPYKGWYDRYNIIASDEIAEMKRVRA